MKWIEAKMTELGVSRNPNYKICFMLDSLAMITVHTPKYGVIDVSIMLHWLCLGIMVNTSSQLENSILYYWYLPLVLDWEMFPFVSLGDLDLVMPCGSLLGPKIYSGSNIFLVKSFR